MKAKRLSDFMGRTLAAVLAALAFCMASATLSAQKAFADDPVTVSNGDYTYQAYFDGTADAHSVFIVGYSGNATQVIVTPSFTKDGKPYPCANGGEMMLEGAFKNNANLAKVAVPSGIAAIGPSAFSGCTSLTEVAIGKDVERMGADAFKGLTNLKTYRISATGDGWSGSTDADKVRKAGIGLDSAGNILPGVTAYVIKGSTIDKGIQAINNASTNGNKITLVYESDPYSKHTVVPDGTSSGDNTGGNTGSSSTPLMNGVVAANPATQFGTDGTAYGRGASEQVVNAALIAYSSEKDPAGTSFGLLKAKATKVTKNSVKLTWSKVSGAKKYVVYGNKCGKKNKMVKQATTAKTSKTFKKVTKKAVKKGTYYKFIVVALDANNNVVSTSKTVHAATSGGKVGNDKKVTTAAKKSKAVVKVKKTFKLKAKAVPASSSQKVNRHRKMAYESTNPKIATVNSKGTVKGVKKGSCYVYAYTQNGVFAKVKITVK